MVWTGYGSPEGDQPADGSPVSLHPGHSLRSFDLRGRSFAGFAPKSSPNPPPNATVGGGFGSRPEPGRAARTCGRIGRLNDPDGERPVPGPGLCFRILKVVRWLEWISGRPCDRPPAQVGVPGSDSGGAGPAGLTADRSVVPTVYTSTAKVLPHPPSQAEAGEATGAGPEGLVCRPEPAARADPQPGADGPGGQPPGPGG